MSDEVDVKDGPVLEKLARLTPIFTRAVQDKLAKEGRLAELAKAATPEEIQAQREIMGIMMCAPMALEGSDLPREVVDAEMAFIAVYMYEIFTQAATRVMPADDLAALVPPELAQEELVSVLEKYDYSALAQVVRKAMPQ